MRHDAIVVGAGHQGLVAAVRLARAGWRTVVVERNERPGGAVMSAQVTRPGFVHDLFSTNQNLFLASPFYAELRSELERHGLRYAVSGKPYANAFPQRARLPGRGADPGRAAGARPRRRGRLGGARPPLRAPESRALRPFGDPAGGMAVVEGAPRA